MIIRTKFLSMVRSPTDGDVRRAVCLQKAVEVVPDPRDPLDDLHQLCVARAAADLRFDQLPPQVAAQETLHWLHVVGTENPPDQRGLSLRRDMELETSDWLASGCMDGWWIDGWLVDGWVCG